MSKIGNYIIEQMDCGYMDGEYITKDYIDDNIYVETPYSHFYNEYNNLII